ncbi:hypothetical protein CMI47_14450 [Candidatus Pacearchaeota archaeon]|nr:hypothetical protein [Candidatus Pacearchaeota archaeon]|tara:strand:+ start:112 stop:294 length:183 start_codon:yes stop_codon:yes gene_type:complete
MKIGDLVRYKLAGPASAVGIILKKVSGLPDQATLQVMWSGMKIEWTCPLDIDVVSDNESR